MDLETANLKQSKQRNIPILIRIPFANSINKENEHNVPKLIKFTIPNNSKQQKNIFRIPLQQAIVNPPILMSNKEQTRTVPQLIDLKAVLKTSNTSNASNINNKITTTLQRKQPKLIRLPQINIEEKKLLESPRRKAKEPEKYKLKELEEPNLVDLRCVTPQEGPTKPILINESPSKQEQIIIQTPDVKTQRQRQFHNNPLESPPKRLPEGKKTKQTNSLKETYPERQFKEDITWERKKNREDELYEVINELLIECKKHRKHKKLRLFDIIDNIPVTSSGSDSDDSTFIHKQSKKRDNHITQLQTVPNFGMSFLPSIPVDEKSANKPVDEKFNNKLNKSDMSSALPTPPLDKYKPKLSQYLIENNKNIDPLSWANIIKEARSDTKETQTEIKTSVQSQEIQTELKEMIEVPKFQTFFSTDNHVTHTEDFCKRVRNEVLQKLENATKIDKNTILQQFKNVRQVDNQTLNNVAVQTTSVETKRSDSIPPVDRTLGKAIPTLPPDVHMQLQYNNGNKKTFLDVMDLDQLEVEDKTQIVSEKKDSMVQKEHERLVVLDQTHDIATNMDNLGQQENIDNSEQHEVGPSQQYHQIDTFNKLEKIGIIKDSGKNHVIDVPEARNQVESIKSNYTAVLQKKDDSSGIKNEMFHQNKISFHIDKSDHIGYKTRSVKQTTGGGKENLKENIKEFSFGLQALEDIQQNLEQELKQSKSLMNTILTLQDGFMDEKEENDTKSLQHSNRTNKKYSVHKYAKLSEKVQHFVSVLNDDSHLIQSTIESDGNGKDTLQVEHFNNTDDLGDILSKTDEDIQKVNSSMELLSRRSLQNNEENNEIDFLSPRSYQSDLKNNERDFLSPRSLQSNLKTTASVRFSQDIDGYDYDRHDDGKQKEIQDEIRREEIRKRILTGPSEEEILQKQKEEKRKSLLNWMKKKQIERQQIYRRNLDEKRSSEHRPLLSKNSFTKRDIDQNTSIQLDFKRAMLEENIQQRLLEAERLATGVMSNGSHNVKTPVKKKNNRYKTKGTIPVRETRSSRIRKTALINEVVKHKNLLSDKKPMKKKKRSNQSNSINRYSSQGDENKSKRYTHENNDNSFNTSLGDRNNASSRVSVEASEFVTKDTYENYVSKSERRLRNTMETFLNYEPTDYYDWNDRKTQRFSYKAIDDISRNVDKTNELQASVSLQSSAEKYEVKNILQRYGLEVDAELFERKSETSKLLAEVDLALLDDNSDVTSSIGNGNIDWNEIENILNE